MTTPQERTRNLLQAGAFFRELEADKRLPQAIRNEAHRLLRHYPTYSDVSLLARIEQRFMGSNILTTEIDRDWWKDYKFDVHTEILSRGDPDHAARVAAASPRRRKQPHAPSKRS